MNSSLMVSEEAAVSHMGHMAAIEQRGYLEVAESLCYLRCNSLLHLDGSARTITHAVNSTSRQSDVCRLTDIRKKTQPFVLKIVLQQL